MADSDPYAEALAAARRVKEAIDKIDPSRLTPITITLRERRG